MRFTVSANRRTRFVIGRGGKRLGDVDWRNYRKSEFEVIPALLSRCQVYILNAFSKSDLESLLERAMRTDIYLKQKNIDLKETEALLRLSGGDGQKTAEYF